MSPSDTDLFGLKWNTMLFVKSASGQPLQSYIRPANPGPAASAGARSQGLSLKS